MSNSMLFNGRVVSDPRCKGSDTPIEVASSLLGLNLPGHIIEKSDLNDRRLPKLVVVESEKHDASMGWGEKLFVVPLVLLMEILWKNRLLKAFNWYGTLACNLAKRRTAEGYNQVLLYITFDANAVEITGELVPKPLPKKHRRHSRQLGKEGN